MRGSDILNSNYNASKVLFAELQRAKTGYINARTT